MNKRFEHKLTRLTVSAVPPDVRRGFASSRRRSHGMGLRPSSGLWPSGAARTGGKAALLSHVDGKAEPCLTSGRRSRGMPFFSTL